MLEKVELSVVIAHQKEINSNLIAKKWRTTQAIVLAG
jgi:hypothetical protein